MTISLPPLQEPEKMAPKVSGLIAEKEKQALEVPTSASSKAPEETIPAHMQLLCVHWGASKQCINAELKAVQRGHQPHMPQSVHMYAECI